MKENYIEKTVVLSIDLEKRIEAMIEMYPGLNFSIIVRQALEQWLQGNQIFKQKHGDFIIDPSKGVGPTLG
jgi:hypothetical protein